MNYMCEGWLFYFSFHFFKLKETVSGNLIFFSYDWNLSYNIWNRLRKLMVLLLNGGSWNAYVTKHYYFCTFSSWEIQYYLNMLKNKLFIAISCETRSTYETFVLLFKHRFVMQSLQSPPLYSSTVLIPRKRKGDKVQGWKSCKTVPLTDSKNVTFKVGFLFKISWSRYFVSLFFYRYNLSEWAI